MEEELIIDSVVDYRLDWDAGVQTWSEWNCRLVIVEQKGKFR